MPTENSKKLLKVALNSENENVNTSKKSILKQFSSSINSAKTKINIGIIRSLTYNDLQ